MWNRASLVAQLVKNLPAVQQTRVWPLGWENPLERKWQPTPVSLPGKSHGQRRLVGCSPWGCKESGTTDWLTLTGAIWQAEYFAWVTVKGKKYHMKAKCKENKINPHCLFRKAKKRKKKRERERDKGLHDTAKWNKVKVKSVSRVQLFATPWTVAYQTSLSMGLFQAIVLERIVISFSRGSSLPRDQTWVPRIVDRRLTVWATREVKWNKQNKI